MEIFDKIPSLLQGGTLALVLYALLQWYKIYCDHRTAARHDAATEEQTRADWLLGRLQAEVERLHQSVAECENACRAARAAEQEWRAKYNECQAELSLVKFENNTLKQHMKNYEWIQGLPSPMLKQLYEKRREQEERSSEQ